MLTKTLSRCFSILRLVLRQLAVGVSNFANVQICAALCSEAGRESHESWGGGLLVMARARAHFLVRGERTRTSRQSAVNVSPGTSDHVGVSVSVSTQQSIKPEVRR